MHVSPALGRLDWEDGKLESSPGCITRLFSSHKKKREEDGAEEGVRDGRGRRTKEKEGQEEKQEEEEKGRKKKKGEGEQRRKMGRGKIL